MNQRLFLTGVLFCILLVMVSCLPTYKPKEEVIKKEKYCFIDYLEEYRCDENYIQRKYQLPDCSFIWNNYFHCAWGCENGKCKECFDSDGGKDYYTKGYYDLGSYGRWYDECADDEYISEWYCAESKPSEHIVETLENYKCPYGCSDGKCNEQPQQISRETCTDSDGGKNYYEKGYVIWDGVKIYDRCQIDAHKDWVYEYHCARLAPNPISYECPYGCSDGKCNEQLQPQEDYQNITLNFILEPIKEAATNK